ncbi:MAG: hypothetical protein AB7V27_04780, partial [Candidatus Binatia bacterium]
SPMRSGWPGSVDHVRRATGVGGLLSAVRLLRCDGKVSQSKGLSHRSLHAVSVTAERRNRLLTLSVG